MSEAGEVGTADEVGGAEGGDAPGDAPDGEPDVGPAKCPPCAVCDYECYLSAVECGAPDAPEDGAAAGMLCPMHALDKLGGDAGARSGARVRVYRSVAWLQALLVAVEERAAAAAAWIERAQQQLGATGGARATLPEMQAVLQAGERLRMEDEHSLRLKLSVAGASAAEREMRLLSAGTRSKRVAQPTLEQCDACLAAADAWPVLLPAAEELRVLAAQGRQWSVRAAEALQASPRELAPLEQLLAEAAAVQLTLARRDECAAAVAVLRWEVQRAELEGQAIEQGPPSVQALRTLVADGAKLGGALPPAQREVLTALARRAELAGQWAEAAAACTGKRPTTLAQMRDVVARAEPLHVQLPLLRGLRERVALCEGWLPRAEAVLAARGDGAAARAALKEAKPLLKVQEVGALAARLDAAVERLDGWLWEAVALFLKPGSERPLLATLTDAQPDAAWPPSDAENAACCACCVPDEEAAAAADADDTWVGCDLCDAWFHAPCVRVPEAQVEELASFHCPRCCARQGSAYAFGTPPPPLKRTRRPPLAKVQQLTAEAATLPLAAAEVEGVLALQREAEAWEAELHRQVQGPPAALAALLEAADALEVQPHDVRRLRAQLHPPQPPPPLMPPMPPMPQHQPPMPPMPQHELSLPMPQPMPEPQPPQPQPPQPPQPEHQQPVAPLPLQQGLL